MLFFFFSVSQNKKIKLLNSNISRVQILIVKPEIFRLKIVSNEEVKNITNKQASKRNRRFLEKGGVLFDTYK